MRFVCDELEQLRAMGVPQSVLAQRVTLWEDTQGYLHDPEGSCVGEDDEDDVTSGRPHTTSLLEMTREQECRCVLSDTGSYQPEWGLIGSILDSLTVMEKPLGDIAPLVLPLRYRSLEDIWEQISSHHQEDVEERPHLEHAYRNLQGLYQTRLGMILEQLRSLAVRDALQEHAHGSAQGQVVLGLHGSRLRHSKPDLIDALLLSYGTIHPEGTLVTLPANLAVWVKEWMMPSGTGTFVSEHVLTDTDTPMIQEVAHGLWNPAGRGALGSIEAAYQAAHRL